MGEILFGIVQIIGRIIIKIFLTAIGRKDLDRMLDENEYSCMASLLDTILGLATVVGVSYIIFKVAN